MNSCSPQLFEPEAGHGGAGGAADFAEESDWPARAAIASPYTRWEYSICARVSSRQRGTTSKTPRCWGGLGRARAWSAERTGIGQRSGVREVVADVLAGAVNGNGPRRHLRGPFPLVAGTGFEPAYVRLGRECCDPIQLRRQRQATRLCCRLDLQRRCSNMVSTIAEAPKIVTLATGGRREVTRRRSLQLVRTMCYCGENVLTRCSQCSRGG